MFRKPTDTKNVLRLADAARDAKDWQTAIVYYEKVVTADPNAAPIWVQLGNSLKEFGSLERSESAYRKALAIDAEQADTHLQLGHVLKLQKRHGDAVASYREAHRLNPTSPFAREELLSLGVDTRTLRKAAFPPLELSNAPESNRNLVIAIELSDLVDFLQHVRYPTGIQRVQLSIAKSIRSTSGVTDVVFVYFDHSIHKWKEVSLQNVDTLIELVASTDLSDTECRRIANTVKNSIQSEVDIDFQANTYLVNVGTSWGYLNYFLALRTAQRDFGLKYVPFVHDCIPLLFPEYCNQSLVMDFMTWVDSIGKHSTFIIANSDNTKRDYITYSEKFKSPNLSIHTVQLNGHYRDENNRRLPSQDRIKVIKQNNLEDGFVLFVSTIEPRKNHRLVLSAWSRLLKEHDPHKMPKLLCVGNSGWMNDDFYSRIASDPLLKAGVIVLNNVSDDTLDVLYEHCLFTVFPSVYEGWGLPITEALSYGKVPLVSRVSAHPEAGGDLALYFELHDESDFYRKLLMLLFDVEFKQTLEGKILSSTPIRSWDNITQDILDAVTTHHVDSRDPKTDGFAHELTLGRVYSFGRNNEANINKLLLNGEIFRIGGDWHAPEPWGCWASERTAEIGFRLPEDSFGEFYLYIEVAGPPNVTTKISINCPKNVYALDFDAEPGASVWKRIRVSRKIGEPTMMTARISGSQVDDFAVPTDGRDPRKAWFGVKRLFVCRTDDLQARIDFQEHIVGVADRFLASRF
jgi:glycosyltransferase involved in cell wall biosynthesis